MSELSRVPDICTELRLQTTDGVPVVNSRDVAEMFGKEHKNVLRDIHGILEPSSNLSPALFEEPWFQRNDYLDANCVSRCSFDLTRQGFTLLVMGWTGERAMQFKVRYIQAFDAMEATLKETLPVTGNNLIQAIREIVAPLAVRFNDQDGAIQQIGSRLDGVANDVAQLKARLLNGRRNPTVATKAEIVQATAELGGRCPCCSRAEVIIDGERSRFAEFDHFYANSKADADHIWLICKPCHQDLTTGRVARDRRESRFRSFQDTRRELPGRQATLF